jgi:hypothetical protein
MGIWKRAEQERVARATIRLGLCGALVCLTAAVTLAQPSTTTETKKFQVISVDGNQLVVKLPEGTKELTVPDDFRFNVDGKMLSVHEMRPGMAGTATITAKTTVTPVTVTEVKNGTVVHALGTSIIVRTDDGVKQFTQSDIDKRGVKIMRAGKPAEISDFRANDRLTATIITTKPPHVMTEKEVQATLAKSGAVASTPAAAASPAPSRAPSPAPAARTAATPSPSPTATSGATRRNCPDGQPPAGSWAHGPRVARCGVGPHRQATSCDALAALLIDSGIWTEHSSVAQDKGEDNGDRTRKRVASRLVEGVRHRGARKTHWANGAGDGDDRGRRGPRSPDDEIRARIRHEHTRWGFAHRGPRLPGGTAAAQGHEVGRQLDTAIRSAPP